MTEFTSFKSRRRSNSMSHHPETIISKFEVREDEPVFEEATMGAPAATEQVDLESVAKTAGVTGSTA